MKKFMLSFEYLMPFVMIFISLVFLASIGYYLTEHGKPEQKLTGLYTIIFTSVVIIVVVSISYKYVKRHNALKTLKNINKLFDKENPEILSQKLNELIENKHLSDMRKTLFFMLARTYQKQDLNDEAHKAFEAADGFWLAHNNLAVLLMSQNKYYEAVEHLRKAVKLNPFEEFLYNQLAWTLQMKMNEPILACKVLESARKFIKNHVSIDKNIRRIENSEEVEIDKPKSKIRNIFM